MPDLAGTLGQTYRIPRQQPPQYPSATGGVRGEQQFDDGLAFEKNLQEVEGRTEEYYNKVAALKSYMADIHKNLGIDVRVPSMSHPESIRLNRIYQKALADIMHQGNLLHEGQVERTMHINRGDIYTKASQGKADSEIRQGEGYYNSTLPQDITQINDLTQQPSYDDQAHQQKLDVYNKRKGELEQEINDTKAKGGNTESLIYQLHGLTPPARAIKQFTPPMDRMTYQEKARAKRVAAAGRVPLEINHILNNANDTSVLSKTITNPNDPTHFLRMTPSFSGANWIGDKQIKAWGHDPKNKDTFLFFSDGTMQDVSKQNALDLTSTLMGANKGTYGDDQSIIDEWAAPYFNDQTSQYNLPLAKEADERQKNNLKEWEKADTNQRVSTLKSKLEALENGSFSLSGRPTIKFVVNNKPFPAEVKRGFDGRLFISNFKELFPPTSTKGKEQDQQKKDFLIYGKDGTSATEMTKFLQKYGAHLNLDQKEIVGNTIVEESKQKGGEIKESMQERVERLKREVNEAKR